MGITMVRKYLRTTDAQAVWKEYSDYMTTSSKGASEKRKLTHYVNRKCTKDTFKGSLVGCQENVSNTTLTIVCTINVSIDCDCFDVSNPNERENIHKIKSSQ